MTSFLQNGFERGHAMCCHGTRWMMIICFTGIGFLGLGCVGAGKNPVNHEQLEDQVKAGVPIGSSRSEVEAWLRSRGIEYHYSGQPKPLIPGDKPSYGTMYDQSGLDPESIGGTVTGFISDTKRDLMVRWSTSIDFFLDKEGKLLKSQVKTQGTGL